jgi:putative toxin-antitoxin system antitoxin component (TIGR02293 family)
MTSAIRDRLGPLKKITTPVELAEAVSHGLPSSVLQVLVSHGVLTASELSLIIPRRTLQDRLRKRLPLTPDASDRAVRLARLDVLAHDVLGDSERARRWLRTPNPSLEGRIPLELSVSSEGSRLVEAVLGRIAHGIPF